MPSSNAPSLGAVFTRVFWMLLGPLLLLTFAVMNLHAGDGWFTAGDIAYLVVLGAMILAPGGGEFRTGRAETSMGEPATQALATVCGDDAIYRIGHMGCLQPDRQPLLVSLTFSHHNEERYRWAMTLSLFLIGLGLVLLILGGEVLLRGAVGIATLLRLTPVVIGLTVVAAGTSVPELAVSAGAAARGQHRHYGRQCRRLEYLQHPVHPGAGGTDSPVGYFWQHRPAGVSRSGAGDAVMCGRV